MSDKPDEPYRSRLLWPKLAAWSFLLIGVAIPLIKWVLWLATPLP